MNEVGKWFALEQCNAIQDTSLGGQRSCGLHHIVQNRKSCAGRTRVNNIVDPVA